MVNKNLFGVVVAVMVAGSGTLASAAVALDTVTLSYQPLPFSGIVLELDKFDPNQGTLTDITINITGTSTGGMRTWTLDSGQEQATITGFGIGAFLEVSTLTSSDILLDPLTYSGGTVTEENPTIQVVGNNSSDTETETVGLSDFGLYTGAGETWNVTISGDVAVSNGNVTGGSGSASMPEGDVFGGATVEVVYTYDPIPEPASLILIGLGSVVIFGCRRHY